jgi:glycosyl transferase family 87
VSIALARHRPLHYFAESLLFAIPAISIGIQISTWTAFAFSQMKNRVDFSAFYLAGWLVRTSQIDKLYPLHPPTFDFIHPAYEAPLFVPLSFLPPRIAYLVWIGVNLALVSLIVYLLRHRIKELRSIGRFFPIALAVAFFPVPYAIAQGQDSLLLAVLVALAFLKMKAGDEFSAGVLLGFGAFRFQLLIPIVLLFLAWKMWKPIAGVISGAGCALLASIAVTGISGQLQYVKMLLLLAQPSSQHVSRMSNLRGFLFAAGVSSPALILVMSIVALALLAWLGRKLNPVQALLFAVSAGCLVSYHVFLHDMSVLVIPLLLLADSAVSNADYRTLGLLGASIFLPEAIILSGSANAMWVCIAIPVIILSVLVSGSKQLTNPAKPLQLPLY